MDCTGKIAQTCHRVLGSKEKKTIYLKFEAGVFALTLSALVLSCLERLFRICQRGDFSL